VVRLGRPDPARLAAVLDAVRGAPLTYSTLDGLHHAEWNGLLDGSFEDARAALRRWAAHRGAGFTVVPDDAPVSVGTEVAIGAPFGALAHAVATCRILTVWDEPDRFGFSYGTLPAHPETGEEHFVVERAGGAVRFRVEAWSRPKELLARLGGPISTWLQDRAGRSYVAAMQRATP
jgi:uncharacterized protein (UPF0548 family)